MKWRWASAATRQPHPERAGDAHRHGQSGVARSRSIWLNMERPDPAGMARASSDSRAWCAVALRRAPDDD